VIRWPAVVRAELPSGALVTLRPLRRQDRADFDRLRREEVDWLRPWEATTPAGPGRMIPFQQLRRTMDRAARQGHLVPFAVDLDGRVVGQMHLFDIVWGARCTGTAGYWLGRAATGRGVATWSLAMLIDFALLETQLHRVEVNVRPENTRSLAVVRRLRLPEEGLRRGLVHVDGRWRDHLTFAVTSEELPPGGLVAWLQRPDPKI
jgi:[ribosomal protein S5]-alanine N-acetyltransferase